MVIKAGKHLRYNHHTMCPNQNILCRNIHCQFFNQIQYEGYGINILVSIEGVYVKYVQFKKWYFQAYAPMQNFLVLIEKFHFRHYDGT